MGAGTTGNDWMTIAAMTGGGALEGALSPRPQNRTSFAGHGDLDPVNMLGTSKDLYSDVLDGLIADAGKPVTIHTTAAPLPSFVGGALPMAISAPAMDPNRLNPDLRTTDGVQISRRSLSSSSGEINGPRAGADLQHPLHPDAEPTGETAIPRARNNPANPNDPRVGSHLSGTDEDKALAAIKLLGF